MVVMSTILGTKEKKANVRLITGPSAWIIFAKAVNLLVIDLTVIEKSRPKHDSELTRLCDLFDAELK